ncbi:hypothetical protein Ae717Ps2_6231 [Pseudonocardia sp. Ae717_Ps2]|uniref:hypothetical protein n=1 Tax=Pseudonocardia sp. Ae717_Ps2 TaxID=1885573 RepID=UPI00094B0F93|nr:hypothetical protein [Pseudonocardia sp. Ae717_Ps2]OLM28635.1 hypothetical protein Ae717Ps2_6231 [Pseudonocardia sp. Ae717_Ps2]
MWPRKSAQSLRERATELAAEAEHSAQVRALSTHPDVVALQVERVRSQVNRLMWTGIVLGMAFCMTNVQEFGAEATEAEEWSPGWWAAWLLDPMVSLVLIAVVLAEQTTSRWQLATPAWARRARWATLGATYAMNTWKAWGALDLGQILLHSVPPLVVFVATEAAPEIRDRLTAAVKAAAADSGDRPVTVAEAAVAAGIAAEPAVVEATEPRAAAALEDAAEPRGLPVASAVGGVRWEREELLSADPAARVEQVKDLIRGGLVPSVELTGSQVAAIFGQSPRTGRRDIEEAQRQLGMGQSEEADDQHRSAGMCTDPEHDGSSGGSGALVLVGPDRGVTLGVGA